MLVWTQLAPATQTGQVGESRRISLVEPSSSVKSAASCSTPGMSGNVAISSVVALEVQAEAIRASAAMSGSSFSPMNVKLGGDVGDLSGWESKHGRHPDRPRGRFLGSADGDIPRDVDGAQVAKRSVTEVIQSVIEPPP